MNRFCISLLLTLLTMTAWADDVTLTWTAAEQGFSDAGSIDGHLAALDAKTSLSISKGTGANTPAYFSSQQAARLYCGNTLTITGQGLRKVVFTFGSGDKSNEIIASTGSYDVSGSWTGESDELTFTIGGSSGHRRIAAVSITYSTDAPASIPTVTSVAAFNKLEEGTTARLYLTSEQNARVLFRQGDEAYLRDRTGALCLRLPAASYNPMPAHDQHVAGYIIGKVHSENGTPQLLPTDSTTTEYLLFAEPVSETATKPESIDVEELGAYFADWVSLSNLNVNNDGTSVTVEYDGLRYSLDNRFGLTEDDGYTEPADGALVNVTGIALAGETLDRIAPVAVAEYPPIEILDPGGKLRGDVNRDKTVDINDAVAVINIMAGSNPEGYDGDVNEDKSTDINDVVEIINIMSGRDADAPLRESDYLEILKSIQVGKHSPSPSRVPEGYKERIVTVMPADAPSDGCVHGMTIYFVNDSVVSYAREEIDTITYVTDIGMKIHFTTSAAVDYLYSQITKIDYVFWVSEGTTDDNANANWKEFDLSSTVSGNLRFAYRLEYPHLYSDRYSATNRGGSQVVVKQTAQYGITYSLEWDNGKVANRWTCYTLHAGNMYQNVKRNDAFQPDPEVYTSSQLGDYSSSGFSRGHLCPSADRLCSSEQNSQTFYLTNMQPQWQNHNGVLWEHLEEKVREWAGKCDTLYVVKAATIADVTLDGSTVAGIYDQRCNGTLIVPKYFYMALLSYNKSTDTYQALGLWTLHQNVADNSTTYGDYAITIDELEQRTGIDFFCNLPDDIESKVESSLNLSYWGISRSR